MPDFPQRRKSIPLVTDLVSLDRNYIFFYTSLFMTLFGFLKKKAMILAANKRSAGVPSNRQTLNDEELVNILAFLFYLNFIF